MPTGFTSEIYDGKKIDFKKFAMNCARAFGACVTMRDDDSGAEIPEKFEPRITHHEEMIAKAKRRLEYLETVSEDRFEREVEEVNRANLREYRASVKEVADLRVRYAKMLAEVRKWNPPTPEHVGLKKFMVEQIESSIEHDCYSPKTETWTAKEYLEHSTRAAESEVEFYTRQKNEEIARCRDRTEWIQKLRESLR